MSELQKTEMVMIPISKIKFAPYNPRRKFTKAERKAFHAELKEFGVLGGLIWNKKTGNLVGGHKRLEFLREQGAKEVSVIPVNLSLAREKILSLALNRHGQGLWNKGKLSKVLNELLEEELNLDIGLTGFNAEIEELQLKLEEKSPEVTFEERLFENHQYVVLVFDNDIDWLHAKSVLRLKSVDELHFKGTTMQRSGLGRVVNGIEAFKRIAEGYGSAQELDRHLTKGEERKKTNAG